MERKLRIGQNISVASLLNDDFSILHPDNQVVVQVKTARTAVVTDDEDEDEEGAEGAEGASEEAAQE